MAVVPAYAWCKCYVLLLYKEHVRGKFYATKYYTGLIKLIISNACESPLMFFIALCMCVNGKWNFNRAAECGNCQAKFLSHGNRQIFHWVLRYVSELVNRSGIHRMEQLYCLQVDYRDQTASSKHNKILPNNVMQMNRKWIKLPSHNMVNRLNYRLNLYRAFRHLSNLC